MRTFTTSLILLLAFGVTWSKANDAAGELPPENKLFTLLTPSESGIRFRNDIVDSKEANFFIYKNFYQGGGVAIGDINNDGLQDLYFAGNQVGDKLYLNKGGLQFEDITQAAGIVDDDSWSSGVSFIDINNDGLQDIYVCKSLYHHQPERRRNKLYLNQGNLNFVESAAQYGLDDPWRSQQASFLDYDRDGDFDIFLINQPPNSSRLAPVDPRDGRSPQYTYRLLENTGQTFEEVTQSSGLANMGFGLSAAVGDFNNDGWQDIYVANDYDGPDFFYINNQDKTFTNKIDDCFRHISNFSMGSDAGDINNDGWLDLSVVDMVAEDNYRLKANMSGMEPARFWKTVEKGWHYQYMFNTLQMNNGFAADGRLAFSDVAQMTGTSNTDWSWSSLFADFDNNGYLDLFVTNGIKREMRNTDALAQMDDYIKQTLGNYQESNPGQTEINIWDLLDLETMLSFFPSKKLINYIFKNEGGLNFVKSMEDWGLDQTTFSTGAAYGDLDNDGDLDLVVSNIDDVAYVYRNNANQRTDTNYLRVEFDKNATGTRVHIYYNGKYQMAELSSASGIGSSSEPVLHFGLGEYRQIDSLRVDWFDGGHTFLTKVTAGKTLKIKKEKSGPYTSLKSKKSNFLFQDITPKSNISFQHQENPFNDFDREVLLPHQMSRLGSGCAVGDVNGDGHEDFFVGGAIGSSGKLYLQQAYGLFLEAKEFSTYPYHEEMGSLFFDADNDGDLDLYVVSGGNEYEEGTNLYQDQLYLNDGLGGFTETQDALPKITTSGGKVKAADYDGDGDIDLFVTGRQIPGQYPRPADSHLLRNNFKEKGVIGFSDSQQSVFNQLGMVTDVIWSDFDLDHDLDLVICGEWMAPTLLENEEGRFTRRSPQGLDNTNGWWHSVTAADLDGDGDDDYIFGNLGLNYKYKATVEEPFSVHYDDFDGNGHQDIVLAYYNYGQQFPLRGRSCSSQQMPGIKKDFPTYDAFASASLADVYGLPALNKALYYEANTFESVIVENLANGAFNIHPLPRAAQVSSINSSLVYDADQDGFKDIIIAGNLFSSEVETPRNDAGVGLYLKGKGGFTFEPVPMFQSGLSLPYDVKELKQIQLVRGTALLAVSNSGPLKLVKMKE